MKTRLLLLAASALLLAGCGKKEATPGDASTNSTNTATSSNPLTAPVDYLGAVAQAKKHSEKVVDTVQVQQAIRMFQASEGRYPNDLNELVTEKYLPALPKLPAGMTYQYNATGGQVKAVAAP